MLPFFSRALAKPIGLTFLSGLFLVAAFPPHDLWWFTFIYLIPWFFALTLISSRKQAITLGLFLSLTMTGLGYPWIARALSHFGNLPWVIAIPMHLIFSTFNQLQFPATGLVIFLLFYNQKEKPHAYAHPLLFSLFYTGLDWLLPRLFRDDLGTSLLLSKNLRTLTSIFGTSGLTFLVVFTNASLFEMLKNGFKKNHRAVLFHAITLTLFLTIANLTGSGIHSEREALLAIAPKKASATVIQANIGDVEKIASEKGLKNAFSEVITTYLDMSTQALIDFPKTDFVVWPETAYPGAWGSLRSTRDAIHELKIKSWVELNKTPLLFGGYTHKNEKDYNSLIQLVPPKQSAQPNAQAEENLTTVYDKNKLLLFGETIPGFDSIPWLRQTFPQVGNFGQGIGPSLIDTPLKTLKTLQIQPIICYEALFPEFTREGALKGSQLILNVTNDSWFGPYAEPELHLGQVVSRAIESGVPQLRATNTGITTLVLPTGEVVRPTAKFTKQIVNYEIPIVQLPTSLFLLLGDQFGKIALALGIFLYSAFLLFEKRKAKTNFSA